VPADFDVKKTKPQSNEMMGSEIPCDRMLRFRSKSATSRELTPFPVESGNRKRKNEGDALLSPVLLIAEAAKYWSKTTQDIWMTSNQKVVARPNVAFHRRSDAEIPTTAVTEGGLCVPDRVLIETLRSV
jgi:hypothetical protein